MPRPVHFEIAANDPAKMEKFYGDVFGWKFEKWDGPIEYWLAKTGEDKQMGINGGLMKKMDGQAYGIINYVDVSSVDESTKKILSSGGKVLMPKTTVPKIGYLAICSDVEGNIFGIIHPDMNAKEEGT